jgi:hypothetical protein
MKQVIYLIMVAALVCGCKKKEKEKEQEPGSIYGVITDKATGEPVRTAGVQLNTGTKTVTGSEGQYEFTDLKAGEYTITVTKTGYTELTGYKITVEAGKTNKGDVQIEKLPMALRIVNDKGQNMDTLAFGNDESLVTRSFNIFNDSPESLEWIITENCNWISELSKTTGTLQPGKQQPIVITIDREKLGNGVNVYILNISSDNGTKELTITATGREIVMLNTLDVSNITTSSATFNGVITATGAPAYTERGFVYSTSSMPTIENTIAKLTAAITAETEYSAVATGLTLNQTYYVRAYAINAVGTAYSANEKSFTTTMVLPSVTTQAVSNKNASGGGGTATFNGTIVNVGDPAYTERGFVYGAVHNPTVDDDTKKIASGTGTGVFSSNITGLTEGTTYYVRAYATNSKGTAYGSEVNFVLTNPDYVVLQADKLMVQKVDIGQGYWTSINSLCDNSSVAGYTDWRLPTKDELAVLYNNRTVIGGFTSSGSYPYYWSSTVYSSRGYTYSWYQDFSSGAQYSDYGNDDCRGRCVRNITP